MKNMCRYLHVWIYMALFTFVNGSTNLTLPTVVNCGDQAVLTCLSTDCNIGYRFTRDGSTIYSNSGPMPGIDRDRYATTVTSSSQVLLTITNIQLLDVGAYGCACGFNTVSASQTIQYECTSTLTLSASTNCGDDVVLTCTSTDCTSAYIFFGNGITVYNRLGPENGIDPARYSATVISNNQVQLTISNMQLSDVRTYSCTCGFNSIPAGQVLQYECKASTSYVQVTPIKQLNITVDRLYPIPSNIVTRLTSYTIQLPGTHNCEPSPTFASHFRCTWVSTASLPDGNHGYTTAVTIGTQISPVSGSFRLVTPPTPTINNLVTISNISQVLHGVEDSPMTFKCVSRGGIPAPTLAWYRGSIKSTPLAQSTISDSVQQSDDTYTVTLTHSFTPSRTDDMTIVLCRVFYPGATIEASPDPHPASAILYIDITGLPSTPDLIKDVHLPNGQIFLLVIPGFHGGYSQTLVAQFSTDNVTWNNVTSRNVGLDEQTTVLNTNYTHTTTLYHVRVFAFNNKGRSRYFSATMTFTTNKENDEQQCLGPAVNNVIAATVAACVTFVLTVLIVICACRCCPDCSERFILRLGHCVSKNKRMFSEKPAPRQVRIQTRKTTTLSDVESKYANSDVPENETTPSYESLQETGQHSLYTELQ